MADEDLAPIERAAEAADLSLSAVIRECLVRHGLETVVALAADRDFKAQMEKNVSGKRPSPKKGVKRTIASLVAYKFEIDEDLAQRWITLGRVVFDGKVVRTPDRLIEPAEIGLIERAAS